NDPCRSAYREGRIWRHGSQPRRPWGSLFRSLTCDIDPRATSLSPSEALSLGHIRLQVLALLDNGASQTLPAGCDNVWSPRHRPRGLSGGTRGRLRLRDGQRDPRRVLESREPAHARDLLFRHCDGAPGRGDLPQGVLDVLGEDVIEDARGQILCLLQSATRRAWRLEHRVVHLRRVVNFPTEDVLTERLRFLVRVRMDLHVNNAVRFLNHVLHPPFS